MVTLIKDKLLMDKNLVLEFITILMVIYIKVFGKMTKNQDKDKWTMQMVTLIMETLLMDVNKVMVFINGQMVIFTKVVLSKISNTEKEYLKLQIKLLYYKECGKMINLLITNKVK